MKRISISVPDEVAAALLVQAEAEHRSVSSLVAHRLATDARTGLPHYLPVGKTRPTGTGRRDVEPIVKGAKR